MRDDDIDTEPDKFLGELLGAIASPLGIAELDRMMFLPSE